MKHYASLLALALACSPAHATSYGPELALDGSFDQSGGFWAIGYGWGKTFGSAWHTEGYSQPIAQPTFDVVPGTLYEASYTISGSYTSSSPGHMFRLRGDTFANCAMQYGDGTFACQLTAPANVHTLMVQPLSGFAGVLDDVSLREVLP